jgi:threonine synthase
MKSVSEAEIRDAYYKLARMGLYVEPTSAAAAAGLSILLREGLIEPTQSVVVILTGTGLKSGPLPTG